MMSHGLQLQSLCRTSTAAVSGERTEVDQLGDREVLGRLDLQRSAPPELTAAAVMSRGECSCKQETRSAEDPPPPPPPPRPPPRARPAWRSRPAPMARALIGMIGFR